MISCKSTNSNPLTQKNFATAIFQLIQIIITDFKWTAVKPNIIRRAKI
jgi:hypothetical protein